MSIRVLDEWQVGSRKKMLCQWWYGMIGSVRYNQDTKGLLSHPKFCFETS